jgi:NAD(P)-dependent dehydrogenase (short-subunit alcohol dehydrogenase family)
VDLELTGKRAIVTGGSRGIGKAVAHALALEGVDVAIAGRTEETLRAAAAELAQLTGRKIVPIACDTGDTASVEQLAEQAIAALGGVDILVNNAARPGGGGANHSLRGLEDGEFFEDMNVKVLGYLRCARAVVPKMLERGWGRIINVGGLAALQSGNPIGSMRNVAVAALTKNLADELGPQGINVNLVHPGLTWTEGVEQMVRARAGDESSMDEATRRMAGQNSTNRIVQPLDVAQVVVFLASPKSVAINGESIAVGGGVGRAIHY